MLPYIALPNLPLARAKGYTFPVADQSWLDFSVPPELEAHEPPEARGLNRDDVRLMVSRLADEAITHTHFHTLDRFLDPGDLLVINTSGTLNAALPAIRADSTPLELHLSTRLPAGVWMVEVRRPHATATAPFLEGVPGETLSLPGGARVVLLTPYRSDQHARAATAPPARLWIATLDLPGPLAEYLAHYGFPIRYAYVQEQWPIEYYQSVYVTELGSAEMPSAGRAFTPQLITRLVASGVQLAPLILHTGVASLESHEPPYEEYYRVPVDTAQRVNAARTAGKRIIAVGTTVVRALETVTDEAKVTHPGEGWTQLIITPERGLLAVNALLTGLHEPRSTHLLMLEALAGRTHLRMTYHEAIREQYLWHEFGDLHLILP